MQGGLTSCFEVLQRRSFNDEVLVPENEDFIQNGVVVDERLRHARRLDVGQTLLVKNDGHLVGLTGTMGHAGLTDWRNEMRTG